MGLVSVCRVSNVECKPWRQWVRTFVLITYLPDDLKFIEAIGNCCFEAYQKTNFKGLRKKLLPANGLQFLPFSVKSIKKLRSCY